MTLLGLLLLLLLLLLLRVWTYLLPSLKGRGVARGSPRGPQPRCPPRPRALPIRIAQVDQVRLGHRMGGRLVDHFAPEGKPEGTSRRSRSVLSP